MSHSDKIPVPLFQVLEEEYIALHGIPEEDGSLQVQLPDPSHKDQFRSVSADLNWTFHPSHIRHPRRLAALLANDPNQPQPATGTSTLSDLNAYDRARHNLLAYLRQRIDPAMLKTCETISQKPEPASESEKQLLSDQLNLFLQDAHLYDEDRFSNYWLGDTSKQTLPSRYILRRLHPVVQQ